MANDINTLRDALFETLRGLRDRENPIEPERARAINETAQTIINSAKLEIDHMRVAGAGRGTDFIPAIPAPAESQQRDASGRTATGMKIVNGNVTTHVMR
jgi:hypothetical protein